MIDVKSFLENIKIENCNIEKFTYCFSL